MRDTRLTTATATSGQPSTALAALRVARLTNQDAVIEIEDHWQTMTDPVHAAAQQQDAEHTRSLLRPLADRGIRIIFEAPLPLFRT